MTVLHSDTAGFGCFYKERVSRYDQQIRGMRVIAKVGLGCRVTWASGAHVNHGGHGVHGENRSVGSDYWIGVQRKNWIKFLSRFNPVFSVSSVFQLFEFEMTRIHRGDLP
jgi:hypothetical protein